jgi:caa(3)-type oxidase subunit IV
LDRSEALPEPHPRGATGEAMSEHAGTQPTTKVFVTVWIGLVAITAIEVWMGYIHLNPKIMIFLLLALSIVKAALIIGYFMHLRYERVTLALWLMPALVICICLMAVFFPDAARALHLRP